MAFFIATQLAYGFAKWESRQDPMSDVTTIYRYQGYLQEMNTGAMKSFQSNPDDIESGCYTLTAESNTLIEFMFDENNYVDATFNESEFTENAQITAFAVMDQFEECGVVQFLTLFDSAASKIP